MNFKSEFLKEYYLRGYFDNSTNNDMIDSIFCNNQITAYIGFDCTANDLHIGSLVQIMILRLLIKHNHNAIILLGQGTTKIGDPSGKDSSRQILDDQTILKNLSSIKNSIAKFLPTNSNLFKFVNNNDWLAELNYINFLRDIGSKFSINRMLNFDSVKLRLERQQNLSFLEFNYMILQAYDFYMINSKYNCQLQIGGSDQWGNIVNGVELTRRLNDKATYVYGLTSPLITTANGKKMGKTEKSAIWLNEENLNPYDYFQYFRNIDDKDVKKFLLLFSELDINYINSICAKGGHDINKAKEILAYETTKLCHGDEHAKYCLNKAQQIFNNNSVSNIEETIIKYDTSKIKLAEIVKYCSKCDSLGQAKKLITGNAVKINDKVNSDFNFYFDSNLKFNLQIGKKKFFKVNLILKNNNEKA
ncbi:MAG: tyrosine--tRNA ligase [Rickettsiales bacterium]|nr:tyrosine--tRNA ligase [Rickettsiales bacterium]